MVREFVESDYDTIRRWYLLHDQTAPPFETLPSYGLIDDSVAAGFLITTDSTVGLMDFYISNPKASKKDRDRVLDLITIGLINRGNEIGLKYFQCTTQVSAVKNRAIKNGFRYMGEYSLFARGE